MTSPKTKGRMLTKDISDSKGFASLSPNSAVLFCMLVPHYSGFGKMNGSPGFIKGEICPRIPYLTEKNIPIYLKEISERTNVKWFEFDGRFWIHSTKFLSEHQTLNPDKLGRDKLPNYSGVTPELVNPEVEVEVEEEGNSGIGVPPGNGSFSPEKMAELWNQAVDFFSEDRLVKIPKVKNLSTDRKKKCSARIRDCRLNEESWKKILNGIHADDWLSGRKTSTKYPDWCATFNYIIKNPSNIIQILEKTDVQ